MIAVCPGKAGLSRELCQGAVLKEPRPRETPLVVQGLRLRAPNAGIQSLVKELDLTCCNLRPRTAK